MCITPFTTVYEWAEPFDDSLQFLQFLQVAGRGGSAISVSMDATARLIVNVCSSVPLLYDVDQSILLRTEAILPKSEVVMLRLIPCLLCLLSCNSVFAGFLNSSDVITGTPTGSWAYSQQLDFLPSINNEFFVTDVSQLSGASFQNFVSYDPAYPPTGILFDPPNSLNVFTTYATSPIDQTFNIRVGFDDGKALFFDDAFIAGGGFSTSVPPVTLSLVANVSKKITVAIYNGDGNGSFGFGRNDGTSIVGPIDGFNGITLAATAVPEPSGLLLALQSVALALVCIRRRQRRARDSQTVAAAESPSESNSSRTSGGRSGHS